jgi:hypothetical protein
MHAPSCLPPTNTQVTPRESIASLFPMSRPFTRAARVKCLLFRALFRILWIVAPSLSGRALLSLRLLSYSAQQISNFVYAFFALFSMSSNPNILCPLGMWGIHKPRLKYVECLQDVIGEGPHAMVNRSGLVVDSWCGAVASRLAAS